ncbi:FAD-binding oxidoreductase [Roseomonas sp. KE2513]|uniref:FAD-binding oxidoreductase n=1 Tax=Roseomonas sp. KE2513 TaxID=2479202 RepID=UPI0018DFC713|nr:FAD-binding oxidoreductase [Roseomonas sp. KE2513]
MSPVTAPSATRPDEATAALQARLTAAGITPSLLVTDADILEPHLRDWRGWHRGEGLALARPRTVAEVQAVLRACHDLRLPVVPQGGNSSMCGASVPASGRPSAVVLSLSALDRIRHVDASGWNLVAEAGCTLGAVQAAARGVRRHFGLDLGARDTARIGGLVSTNAGGMGVLRYGTMRDQVLGLEVVLADGTLWSGLRALRKDNSGLDLKQLFIGTEGTHGVVTAACLRLHPPETHVASLLLALPDLASANRVAEIALRLGGRALSAMELVPGMGLALAAQVLGGPLPVPGNHAWNVLLHLAGEEQVEPLAEAIASGTIEQGAAVDGVLAQSGAQEARLWALRDAFSEAHRLLGLSFRFDLAVPVGKITDLAEMLMPPVLGLAPGARFFVFGHLGDGNLHVSIAQPERADAATFATLRPAIEKVVHEMVWQMGGTISAEHGIGQLHREELALQKPPEELALMRAVKGMLDPKGILNPGQLLPD